MSYNGIGLKTAKGSSTSGYVVKSLADNNEKRDAKNYQSRQYRNTKEQTSVGTKVTNVRNVDNSISQRNSKREVEVKVSELRDRLEDEGNDDEDVIDVKCNELRSKLLSQMNESQQISNAYIPRSQRDSK
ncbi:HDR026Cp [Eremothecium sinecaudum]|uniref:Pre-mRNA-splicing factor CWC21 n=1 Tax=Eremothecium sinecaudum TaxID=45286 RepID=A0A0X8HSS3_9SACH|nr:HDR026Cp [Eremothecium sinecaudum]AMD20769.1 HDR026Cp [Eremothecium sinecaudum]